MVHACQPSSRIIMNRDVSESTKFASPYGRVLAGIWQPECRLSQGLKFYQATWLRIRSLLDIGL